MKTNQSLIQGPSNINHNVLPKRLQINQKVNSNNIIVSNEKQ